MEQDVIKISSDEELEDSDEVMRENNKSSPLKKRTLSSSATGSPSKRRITASGTLNMAIEVQDSDDDHPTAMKAIPATTSVSDTREVKIERGNLDEAAKDKLGRYIVTQKVKVDSIENLSEVPARWPIPTLEGNTAYVIDLNNDKKWQELDTNNKKKRLDCFVKQEVCPLYSHIAYTGNLTELFKPYCVYYIGPRFLGSWDQSFDQS
jgi:hypothetical protein